jgi:hypothetical protein
MVEMPECFGEHDKEGCSSCPVEQGCEEIAQREQEILEIWYEEERMKMETKKEAQAGGMEKSVAHASDGGGRANELQEIHEMLRRTSNKRIDIEVRACYAIIALARAFVYFMEKFTKGGYSHGRED